MARELVGVLNEIAGTQGLEAAGAAEAALTRINEMEAEIDALQSGGGGDHPDLATHEAMGLVVNTDTRLSDARAPLTHGHVIADVTNLQTTLDSKVASTDTRLSDARTPLPHNHDDRYYTEAEVDSLLAGVGGGGGLTTETDPVATAALETHKTSADHDTRYYTQAQVDALIAAVPTHTHTAQPDITNANTAHTIRSNNVSACAADTKAALDAMGTKLNQALAALDAYGVTL